MFKETRALALSAIAKTQATVGDTRGAAGTFSEAFDSVRGVKIGPMDYGGEKRLSYWESVFRNLREWQFAAVKALAGAGNIDGALDVAWSIDDTIDFGVSGVSVRLEALCAIAKARARAGDIDSALDVAWSIDDALVVGVSGAPVRSAALCAIAKVRAGTGDIDGALDIARSIDRPYKRDEALCAIAEARVGAGDIKGALDIARSINDASSLSSALRVIAEAQAAAADTGGAAHTFSVDAFYRVQALCAMACTQVDAANQP